MKTKAREYLAKAKQREERARKIRHLKDKDWQLTLARTYRMLAEAESEVGVNRWQRNPHHPPYRYPKWGIAFAKALRRNPCVEDCQSFAALGATPQARRFF